MTLDTIEKEKVKFEMVLSMILDLRFGDGTGEDLQVALAEKEIMVQVSKLLSQAREEERLRIKKEVIGKDETPEEYKAKFLTLKELDMEYQAVKFHARNELRKEQRIKLSTLASEEKI